jgi:hypothetical protein
MARPATIRFHPQASTRPPDVKHDAAAAAVDANVQAHHQLLMCLDQTRRAHEKMLHDWMWGMLDTAHTLGSSTDKRQWLQAPAALAWAMCSSALAAQGTALAAWSEFQRSALDQVCADSDFAADTGWPDARNTSAAALPSADNAVDPPWVNDAMKTYDRLAAAWTSAWGPDGHQPQH